MSDLNAPGAERVVWLLTVETPGGPVRVASVPVVVSDATTGATLDFRGGLVSAAVTLAGTEGGQLPEASAPVEVLDDDATAELAAAGIGLALCLAELAIWVDGTDWSRRRVLVSGQVLDPEWGEAGEPVRFTVAARTWADASAVPSITARVDGVTWPDSTTILPDKLGTPYPVIIGNPGKVSTAVDSSGLVAGSRAVWARHGRNTLLDPPWLPETVLVIAGHHVQIGENGTFGGRVYIRDADGLNATRVRVRNGFDGRGQPIAWLSWWGEYSGGTLGDQYEYDAGLSYDYSPTDDDAAVTRSMGDVIIYPTFVTEDERDVFVSWYDDIDGGSALVWRGGALRNAADVVEWACSQSGQRVDVGAFVPLRAWLSPFVVDAVIEGDPDGERTPVLDWLRESVLAHVPVGLYMGPRGVTPYAVRHSARPEEAVHVWDLDADPTIGRDSGIRVDTGQIANRITVRYARSLRTGEYLGQVVVGADAPSDDEPDRVRSAACVASVSRYRWPNGSPYVVDASVDLHAVYDTSAAVAIGEHIASKRALPVETLALSLPLATLGYRVAPGDIGLVTDSALSLSGRLAQVERVDLDAASETVAVELRLITDLSAMVSP